MAKAPAFQFYAKDWLADLSEHPLEIEGAWIRFCAKAWLDDTKCSLSLTLEQWGRLFRCLPEDAARILRYIGDEKIGEISANSNAFSRDSNEKITITCRRMRDEESIKESGRLRAKRHYESRKGSNVSRDSNENLTSPSASASASALSSSPYGLSKETPSVEGVLSASPPDGGRADDPAQSKPETGLKAREADAPKRAQDDRTPHQAIIALYHEILTMCPKVEVWNDDQRKRLKTRWNEKPERKSLDWWREFFQRCAASDWLTGRVSSFVCDLDWLVGPKNMAKVLNGRYDNRGPRTGSSLGDRNAMVAQQAIERRRLANAGQ
jgi:hypothetical protein